jgi:SAM-dependent methyltransferase
MSFDTNWEKKIYKKKRQINNYPFDWVVSSIIKYIPKNKKKIAVELGCGAGNNLEFLSDQGYSKIIGVDGSKSAIQYAKKKLINKKKIELVQADFAEISFENVDLFLDRGSITHNKKEDIKKIFLNILSQLNPGGFFLSSMFCTSHYGYKDKNGENFFSKEMKVKNGIVASFFQEKEIRSLFKNFNLVSLVKETNHDKITNKQSSMWNVICKKNTK